MKSIEDKVIKDVGEAYIALHDRVPELEQELLELQAEVKKWKLECCKWQDLNSGIEAENKRLKEDKKWLWEQVRVRGERMEFMKAHMRGYDYEHLRHAKINRWFDDNGKVLDD